MHVLIVEQNADLAAVWSAHLERNGASVRIAAGQADAIAALCAPGFDVDVVVLNVLLPGESSIAVADFASYRHPRSKIVFITGTTFFSDGSLFAHIPNARAFLGEQTRPDDLAVIVDHLAHAP